MATKHPLSVVVCRPTKRDSLGKGERGEFESTTRTIATIASTFVLNDCVGQKQLVVFAELVPKPIVDACSISRSFQNTNSDGSRTIETKYLSTAVGSIFSSSAKDIASA